MGFSFRINFVDVVCDNSLKSIYVDGRKSGFQFDIRLSYYRGHYLSDIDLFEVRVDGEKMEDRNVTFGINGKEFTVAELPYCISEFWTLLEPARIRVLKEGGLESGEHHIEVTLMMRVPYLPLPGGEGEHNYMPLDACGEKTLVLADA